MFKFAIEFKDSEISVNLDVTDIFSGKDRVALTERLSRPGESDSHGRVIYEDFMVTLGISNEIPTSESLRLLAEGLREIKEADQFNRCTHIILDFPINCLPHVVQDLGSLTLPYLKSLHFCGLRTMLPLILRPGTIPSRLQDLEISCELTVCDCAYLLKELSDTLWTFSAVRLTLPDHGTSTTMFPGFRSHLIEGRIRMTTLKSFKISELFVNPSEMLNKFEMPSLRIFMINSTEGIARKGITQKDFKWIPWNKVRDTNVPDV